MRCRENSSCDLQKALNSGPGFDGLRQPSQRYPLNLKVDDLCQTLGENGGSGYEFARRATNKMGNTLKLLPPKVTETFGAASGLARVRK